MVDQELVEYIRQNESQYGVAKIRSGLISQGLTAEEVDEAIAYVRDAEKDEAPVVDQESQVFIATEKEAMAEDLEGLFDEESGITARKPRRLGLDFIDLEKAKPYGKKAEGLLLSLLGFAGVEKEKRQLAAAVVTHGAVAFLVITIIAIFTQYVVGQMIYPQIETQLGVLGKLALPEVFIIELRFGALFLSLLGALIWGGVLTFVFARYLGHYIPAHILPNMQYRLAVFYFLLHFVSGVFLDGLIVSREGVYMKGYGLVLIGIAAAAYVGALYFTSSLEGKYPGRLKTLLYDRW